MSQPTQIVYPEGLDCFWMGSDASGNLGMFITAGLAPIPLAVLLAPYDIDQLAECSVGLPVVSKARVLDEYIEASEFTELAERGFFTFDWSDVHRVDGKLHGYQKVGVPTCPLHLSELDGFMGTCGNLVRIPGVEFERDEVIRLPSLMDPVFLRIYC